jgi:hypothetical protein
MSEYISAQHERAKVFGWHQAEGDAEAEATPLTQDVYNELTVAEVVESVNDGVLSAAEAVEFETARPGLNRKGVLALAEDE